MRVAIVADVFPPLRSSGAVQLRDLAREFVRQGHETSVLVASPDQDEPFRIDTIDGALVARLKSPQTKDVSYVRRVLGEFLMPWAMRRNLSRSPIADRRYDAIIWYSPTIFLGPIVRWLKRQGQCPSYLIIRDIFPQWAADMGLISRGPVFRLLDAVAQYQYRSADVIGVQTPGNLAFFDGIVDSESVRMDVLQNWLGDAEDKGCVIDVSQTPLAGRRIFVYAGNMGVAQHMDKLLSLAVAVKHRSDIGFLFVGRGSEAQRLRDRAANLALQNVLFHDEINPDDIPGLYRQCHVGLISLDSRHMTHNIPGKFLTYMQAGLPVLASINAGNDLQAMVDQRRVGRVSVDPAGADLPMFLDAMIENELADAKIADRCRAVSDELFSVRVAVDQIVQAMRTSR
jgi:glycosyltransferase involved in cell wall biosynthesis